MSAWFGAVAQELGLRLSPALFDRYIEQSVLLADVDADGLLTAAEFVVTFATVFAPSRKFGNALRKAAGRGERDVVLDLLARGCDPNVGDGRGWTGAWSGARARTVRASATEERRGQ